MNGARSKASINRRLLLFALGATLGTAATAFFFAESTDLSVDRYTKNTAEAEARSGRIEAEHDCRKLVGFERFYCDDQALRRTREAQRQQRETAADEKQAIWTKAAGMSAGAALFFNLVTIIAVFLTYQEQRVANGLARQEFLHAREEADAVARANERAFRHAEVTARARLRAYLNSIREQMTETGPNEISIQFAYKNVGLTPAHEVLYVSRATFHPREGGGLETRELVQQVVPYGMVGPQAENTTYSAASLETAETTAIKEGKAAIGLITTITYRDELGDRWEFSQKMQIEKSSFISGMIFTRSCMTKKLSEAEADEADEKLPLEGGSEGQPEGA